MVPCAAQLKAAARRALVTALAVALAACSSDSRTGTGPGTGTVSGTITSPQRGPLGGVTVTASPSARSTVSSVITGAYAIDNLSAGTYTLALGTFPSSCADPGSKQATVTAGGATSLNFTVPCSRLYVANGSFGGGSITIYPAGSPVDQVPAVTIAGSNTGLSIPSAVAADAAGQVYVSNAGSSQLTAYPAGATGNAHILWSVAVTAPRGVAVTASQVYVADRSNNRIEIFNAPDGKLLGTLHGNQTGLSLPRAVVVDAAGRLCVANDTSITVYAAGDTGNVSPIATISGSSTGLVNPAGIALDTAGVIYVANADNNSITVYAAGATGNAAPIATISGSQTGLSLPSGIALDGTGRIFVSNYTAASITIYARGATGNAAPVVTISGAGSGLNNPLGIAIGP